MVKSGEVLGDDGLWRVPFVMGDDPRAFYPHGPGDEVSPDELTDLTVTSPLDPTIMLPPRPPAEADGLPDIELDLSHNVHKNTGEQ